MLWIPVNHPIRSLLTINPFFDIKGTTKQLTQTFVRLIDQLNFEIHHVSKFTLTEGNIFYLKKKNHYIRLKRKSVGAPSELEPSNDEINNDLDAKNENTEMKRFDLVFDKVTSIQLEMYKKTLPSGTHTKLPVNNQAIVNVETVDKF